MSNVGEDMSAPRNLKYTKTHEWVRLEDGLATVGITDYAQEQLSDVTYVELPAPGDELDMGDEIAVVESVKAASDIYAPISGTVREVNSELDSHPEAINSDPFGEGWLFKLEPSDPSQLADLMDVDEYEESLPEDEG